MTSLMDKDSAGGSVTCGIVISDYYKEVAKGLLTGATDVLDRGANIRYEIVRVFGAWEIPLIAREMAQSTQYQAIITLGCIIRGQTSHFDHLCQQCAAALMSVSMDYKIPVGFGVLTCENYAQAAQRSQTEDVSKNKGHEAASAVLGSLEALAKLRQSFN